MKKTLAFAALLLWADCVTPDPARLSSSTDTATPAEAIAAAKAEYRAEHQAKAAALDRQHRFDQAGAAYRALHGLIGDTTTFYNKFGYSMLLRGNLTMLANAAGYAPSGAGMLRARP